MKVKTALSVLPLIAKLKTERHWTPEGIADFSLSQAAIRPLQVRSELHRFAQIVADLKPKNILEIGTCYGGTLCVIARLAAPDATIASLDLPGGDFGGGYRWFQKPILKAFTRGNQRLHLLRGDSHDIDMETAVRDIFGKGRNIDLLFIDGDHSYKGVKQDYDSYACLVRSGGIVALHDIADHTIKTCQVDRFWNEIKPQFRHEEIIENRSQGWAGIGIIYAP